MNKVSLWGYLILLAIRHNPGVSGVKIIEIINNSISSGWNKISVGTFYPTIAKLEANRWVKREEKPANEEEGRRQICWITEEGTKTLRSFESLQASLKSLS